MSDKEETEDKEVVVVEDNEEDEKEDENEGHDEGGEEESDHENEKAKWSCGTIRSKISAFLAKKEMTQTKFLSEISCNSNSLGRFMKLKGL